MQQDYNIRRQQDYKFTRLQDHMTTRQQDYKMARLQCNNTTREQEYKATASKNCRATPYEQNLYLCLPAKTALQKINFNEIST